MQDTLSATSNPPATTQVCRTRNQVSRVLDYAQKKNTCILMFEMYLVFFKDDELPQLVILLHQSPVHLPKPLHLLIMLTRGTVVAAAHSSSVSTGH